MLPAGAASGTSPVGSNFVEGNRRAGDVPAEYRISSPLAAAGPIGVMDDPFRRAKLVGKTANQCTHLPAEIGGAPVAVEPGLTSPQEPLPKRSHYDAGSADARGQESAKRAPD